MYDYYVIHAECTSEPISTRGKYITLMANIIIISLTLCSSISSIILPTVVQYFPMENVKQ